MVASGALLISIGVSAWLKNYLANREANKGKEGDAEKAAEGADPILCSSSPSASLHLNILLYHLHYYWL